MGKKTEKSIGPFWGANDEIFLECKQCKKIVYRPIGALMHGKSHKLKLNMDTVSTQFTLVKDPPPEIVKELKKKSAVAKQQREISALQPAPPGQVHYGCKKCDWIVTTYRALDTHCRRKHHQSPTEAGFYETTNPPTRPLRRREPTPSISPNLADLIEHMPQVVGITEAEATEGGVLLTVQFKIPTAYVASIIVPTLR